MNNKVANFPDIVNCIEELDVLLKCNCCGERMDVPITLWSCDHVFCTNCMKSFTSCPNCKMPTWAQDQSKNSRLENISSLNIQLKKIVNCRQLPLNKKLKSVQSKSILSEDNMEQSMFNDAISCISKKPKIPTVKKRLSKENIACNSKRKVRKSVTETLCKSKVIAKKNTSPKSAGTLIQKNARGETQLHIAAMQGDIHTVEKLIQNKADINAKDHAGWTPLHEACNKGYIEIVNKLLDAGALIDIPGYENDTPLMDAVSNNRFPVIEMLLQHGADVTLRNSAGKTALDLAQSERIRQIISEHLHKNSKIEVDTMFLKVKPEFISIAYSSELNFKKIKNLSNVLNATLINNTGFNCSHFIVPFSEFLKTRRTLKYLQAMATGAWIINEKWVDNCIKAKDWSTEVDYQIKGCFEDAILDGPMRSRQAKLKCLPRLFDGCHFFLYGHFSPPFPSKQQLTELIKEAGGYILAREPKPDSDIVQSCSRVPYHAHSGTPEYYFTYYILYDPSQKFLPRSVRLGKVCTVTASWLLDCVSQFMICDTL